MKQKKIKFKKVNDKVKEQRVIKENDDEEKKGKEEKDNEDTINLIKIYIDLYILYQEIITNNLLSKNFQEFTNKINEYPRKNYIFESFDNFCKVLRVNLYGKMGNKFSEIFFQNMEPKILKFFIRFYMLRIFFAIKDKDNNIRKISIINIRNMIAKEILLNIIIKMINDKVKRLKYFELLLYYIYFENVFVFHKKNKKDNEENENIYDKYESYYDGLTAFNNDNYSYINEYKWKENYDQESEAWNQFIKNEYINEGSKIIFDLLEKMSYQREQGKFNSGDKTKFYETLFELLKEKLENKGKAENKENQEKKEKEDENKKIKDIIKIINGIIKIILADEKNIFKSYLKYEEKNKQGIFKPIIDEIKKNINSYINKQKQEKEENKKENDENKQGKEKEKSNLEAEFLNSLIILLESFGEYKNKYLLEFIFENNEKEDRSVFNILVDAYEKILKDLN